MKGSKSRREFIRSATAMGSLSLMPDIISNSADMNQIQHDASEGPQKSLIGNYGPWANTLREQPPALSYRNSGFDNLESWRKNAMTKTLELVSPPEIRRNAAYNVKRSYSYDGLDIEELTWQLPYGQATEAILLKPSGVNGKLPGILGLHDHGGNKYFGKRKITKTSDKMHPLMVPHQEDYYGGRPWANELAKKGFVVLVPDAFSFASRRVLFENMTEIPWGHCATTGMTDADPEKIENITAYNNWASEHEHIMAKSLFCAGTTWPGVFLFEDQWALDILSSRDDVDDDSLGCAGLSGGGLRTIYLAGLDHRITCAAAAGFMSTWTDFLLYKSFTHTWMTYTPVLPNYLEFPEILGLRAPLPTMTLNNNQDGLFTLTEMQKADRILQDIFRKAGAEEKYRGNFYEGEHKFDVRMQEDAFEWFKKWLT